MPPRSPELNPVVSAFMRDNWFNRIFKSYEDIVALRCQAEQPHGQPWKIMSLGMRLGAWVLINDRWY